MALAPRLHPGTLFVVVRHCLFACALLAAPAPSPAAAGRSVIPAAPATGPLFAPLWQPVPAAEPARAHDEDALEAPGLNAERETEAEFFRRLAGGDVPPDAWRRMWNDAGARVLRESRGGPGPARLAAPTQADAVNTWQLIGPNFSTNVGGGLMTGRVRDVDPVNVRVLAASGGLWRFNILTAVPMSDGVPASWFGSFASRPTDASTILLGTGEWSGQGGTGLYRSTDGGATWTHLSPGFNHCARVRWSADGATAYAATDFGVYRSTDGGVTWARPMSANVSDLTIVPGQPGRVFATVVNQGVYRSIDDGATWSLLNTGGAPVGTGLGSGAVTAVYVAAAGAARVYAAYGLSVWRSDDGGVTWTSRDPTGVSNSGYGPVISVCPNDPNTVLYGNVGYKRSIDGGVNWTSISSPHLHADYHVFGWDANGDGVWAGHDGGWSHSLDRGATWSSSSNVMPVSQFYDVDCVHDGPGPVIGGTQDNNVLYTPGGSVVWNEPAVGSTEGDASSTAIDPYNPNRMWAAAGLLGGPIAFGRWRSLDGGTTWTNVSGSLVSSSWNDEFTHDNASPVRLFTSADRDVFESTDGGTTWAPSNLTSFPQRIMHLRASTRVAGGAVLWATLQNAGTGQQVYVRDNGTWFERTAGLTGIVVDVVPHPWAAYADEAWAVTSGSAGRVWHTANRGVTWTDVTGDLPPSLYLSDLVPNPRHTGEWYVGTTLGVWRTTNGGANWEPWTNGMPAGAVVSDLTYIDQTTTSGQFFVVAGTYGRSVWKRDAGGSDPFPTITLSAPTVDEGASGQRTAWFRATLAAPQSLSCSVNWATVDGTALAGSDYVASAGTLTFPANTTVQYFTVPVIGDATAESDETFQVAFSNPLRVNPPGNAACTILDDDASGLVCHDLYVTDGAVNAVAVSGNTVYVGGSFTSAGPATGHGVPLDPVTGAPLSLPRFDGFVSCAVADGAGGWYVGGSFTHVGGLARPHLAHLLADGSVDAWNPAPDGWVNALAVYADKVYVGGAFTTIGGLPRPYLACVPNYATEPTDWNPNVDGTVYALLANGNALYVGGDFLNCMGSPRARLAAIDLYYSTLRPWNPGADAGVAAFAADAGTVWVAGNFTSIGNAPRQYLAALDSVTAQPTAWNPAPDNYVYAITTAPGSPLYVGGAFANIGGLPRARLVALDRASAAPTPWNPAPDGAVTALALSGGTLYAGGSFSTIGGQARGSLAALGTADGLATAWSPSPNSGISTLAAGGGAVFAGGSFSSFGALPRGSIAAYDATTGALRDWNPNVPGTVYALAAGGGVVYAGGSFTTAGGQPRSRLAAFDSTTAAVTAWDPNANGTVRCLLLSGTRVFAGGQFTQVSFSARNRAASITTGGSLQSWNPNANGTVSALATDGTFVYAGGGFTSIGGQPRNALAQLSTTGGTASTWNPNVAGPVQALLCPDPSLLYVGGQFNTIAGLVRPNLALISLSNASVSSWTPAPNDAVTAIAPGPGSAQVYVGGAFTQIGGVGRSGLALVRSSTSQVANWAPQPDNSVNALAVSGETVWIGGAFQSIGGSPKANVTCAIQQSAVDVPVAEPPAEFALHVSPNPSGGRFTLDYVLPEAARVRVAVFDVSGRRVGPVLDEWRSSGVQRSEWNGAGGRGVGPGIYFVHLGAGGRTAVRRIVVL